MSHTIYKPLVQLFTQLRTKNKWKKNTNNYQATQKIYTTLRNLSIPRPDLESCLFQSIQLNFPINL
jgi:hypothetical protein